MKNFWSSSTIKSHAKAKAIEVPVKRFNDELERLQPSFLIIDIEGGEQDFIRYARLDGVNKVCIELHPFFIDPTAVAEVDAFFETRVSARNLPFQMMNTNYICVSWWAKLPHYSV
jgi:hypothetical protein